MTDDHARRTAGRVYGTFAFTLGLVLFSAVNFDFYYDLNDDTMIKDILSGAYTGTPSGYCIQMLYPLAWFIALLYRAIPSVPWYGLFLCLCQFSVLCAVAWRLMGIAENVRNGVRALLAEAAVVFGLFLRQVVIIQYSVTAGFCMAGAVFLFMTAPCEQKVSVFFRKNLLPLALVILAFMIRTEVCIMLLPFLLLAGLVKWGSEEKIFTGTNFRKYLTLITTALLGMAAVYCVDVLAYRGSEWGSFRSFFDARTKLYDFYGLPDYDGNIEFYTSIGLSEESFALLENYNFALDDSINTWSLEAIVEYQEQRLHNTFGVISKNSVREALWLYKRQLADTFGNMARGIKSLTPGTVPVAGFMVFLAYVLYMARGMFCADGAKKVSVLWKILLLLVIRSIIWLYLYMVDRVPERVTVPLLGAELVTVISFMLNDMMGDRAGTRHLPKKAAPAAWAVCALGACVLLAGSMSAVRSEYRQRAVADARWNALTEYCRKNGQNYYVIDVYSSTSYNNIPYSEKMFRNVDDSYKNFDICGGWAAKSPLTKEKLARAGRRDIQSALCSRKKTAGKKTCFVAAAGTDLDWLAAYYRKRGMEIQAVCTDRITAGDSETVFEVYELNMAVAD